MNTVPGRLEVCSAGTRQPWNALELERPHHGRAECAASEKAEMVLESTERGAQPGFGKCMYFLGLL